MVEWIEANIFVNERKQKEVLLNFIKPLVQRLRSEFNITAYHFLHEPNNEIRFRVLTTLDKVEKIKELINDAKKMEQIREVKYPKIPYQGERQAFGEDGWKSMYKFLEAGSDFALDLIDENVRKGQNFNPLAFSHYFLNQTGFDQLNEANFHATASIERIATWTLTELKRLEERIMKNFTQLEARIQVIQSKE